MSEHAGDLALALDLAAAADRLTMQRFLAGDLQVSTKPDRTPVTDADGQVERAVRSVLAQQRPGDAILGEEQGGRIEGRTWVVDPIDGTKNYLRGVPVWATLIGLIDGAGVPVGVVSAPALGRRWWAATGHGAWTTALDAPPRRCRVSAVDRLDDAFVSYSSRGGWSSRPGHVDSLVQRCWRSRAFGDFWSYMLVAEGACDIATEPELAVYDMAALVPIVSEAGGQFTDLDGRPGPFGSSALATNGRLHEAALAALRT